MGKLDRICRSGQGWPLILKGKVTKVRRRECREPHLCEGARGQSGRNWAGLNTEGNGSMDWRRGGSRSVCGNIKITWMGMDWE